MSISITYRHCYDHKLPEGHSPPFLRAKAYAGCRRALDHREQRYRPLRHTQMPGIDPDARKTRQTRLIVSVPPGVNDKVPVCGPGSGRPEDRTRPLHRGSCERSRPASLHWQVAPVVLHQGSHRFRQRILDGFGGNHAWDLPLLLHGIRNKKAGTGCLYTGLIFRPGGIRSFKPILE